MVCDWERAILRVKLERWSVSAVFEPHSMEWKLQVANDRVLKVVRWESRKSFLGPATLSAENAAPNH